MALNENIPIDGDGITSGTRISQICAAIRKLRAALNAGGLDYVVPIGGIIAWHKDFANTPALLSNYVECNGQVLSDSQSLYDGQTIPDLNGNARFLRGSATSGTEEADAFQGHNHNINESGEVGAVDIRDGSGGGAGGFTNSRLGVGNSGTASLGSLWVDDPKTDGVNGTPRTDSETRPINMSVVWVMRIK